MSQAKQEPFASIVRRYAFFVFALAQMVSLIAFFYAGARADRAMDKSGIGNLSEWQRWTDIAGVALHLLVVLWIAAAATLPWSSGDRDRQLAWLFAGVPAMFVLGFIGMFAAI